MDKYEKIFACIALGFLVIIGFGFYHEYKNIEKQLNQKTIECDNWKTLYQLSEK